MSRVIMRVSVPGLRMALRLPDEVAIAAAGTECHSPHLPGEAGADVLVLTADMPDAPGDAVEAVAEYTHSGHRDPVELTRWLWYRADGTEIGADGAGTAAPAETPPPCDRAP